MRENGKQFQIVFHEQAQERTAHDAVCAARDA
jgi:hypothetical protein